MLDLVADEAPTALAGASRPGPSAVRPKRRPPALGQQLVRAPRPLGRPARPGRPAPRAPGRRSGAPRAASPAISSTAPSDRRTSRARGSRRGRVAASLDVVVGAGFTVDALEQRPRAGEPAEPDRRDRHPGPHAARHRRTGHAAARLRPQPERATRPTSGVGFARTGNRYWSAALAAGIVSRDRDTRHALVHHGVGMTDLVKRATPRADELTTAEYRAGLARVGRLVRLAPTGRGLLRRAGRLAGGGRPQGGGRRAARAARRHAGVRDALDQRPQRPHAPGRAGRPPRVPRPPSPTAPDRADRGRPRSGRTGEPYGRERGGVSGSSNGGGGWRPRGRGRRPRGPSRGRRASPACGR